MTITLWNFINALIATFALGVTTGIVAVLIGLSISAKWYDKRHGKEE